jgi:cytochrome c peroxidase
MNRFFMALCSLAVAASAAMASDIPSIERGKGLFNGTTLGTNGKSCATCHYAGKGLERAAGYDEVRLEKIINQCIGGPLKGTELAPDSTEMKSLIMYLQSLVTIGKK